MPDLYREPTEESPVVGNSTPIAPQAPLGSLEQEIAELEKQLAQKRALIGAEKEQPLEQILAAEKPTPAAAAATAPAAPVSTAGAAIKPAARDLKDLEKNQQLKNLVDLAFQKGIAYATDIAREMNDPYLMDEFHDTLIDQLHKELVERGKLEEI